MYKVMVVNNSNANQWFSSYARQNPNRQALNLMELQTALQALGLSRVMTQNDMQNLAMTLNSSPMNGGMVEIREIEEAIRKSVTTTSDA